METLIININLTNLCQNEEKQDTREKSSSPAEVSESLPDLERLHRTRAETYAKYFMALNVDKFDPTKLAESVELCYQQYREDQNNGYL